MTPTKTRKWVNASKVLVNRIADLIDENNNSYVIELNYNLFTQNPDPQEGVDKVLAVVASLSKTVFRHLENELSHNTNMEKVTVLKAAMKELSHIAKSYNQGHIPKV